MNILIITQNISLGGAQRVVIQLSDYLTRSGHNAWILTPHVELEGMPEMAKSQKYIVSPHPILKKVGYEYKMRGNLFLLAYNIFLIRKHVSRIIEQYSIDLVSAHNPPSNWIASFSKVPVVWSCNEPISLCFSKRKPDYFPLSVESPGLLGRSLQTIYEVVDYGLCRWGIDEIAVLSEYTQRGVQNIYGRKAQICRIGADFKPFQRGGGQSIRARFHCEDGFLLLHVGYFKPEKNQDVSVRALSLLKDKIPNLRLLFVGAGALEEQTRRLAQQLGVQDRVLFAGRVPEEDLPNYYSACDLVIFPALRQSWGLVVFEALAAGKLSLASADCGASEILMRENIGFVCAPTPEEFANKLLQIYPQREHFGEMVRRGQDYLIRELSYETYGKRMLELFQETLSKSARAKSRYPKS